MRRSLTVLRVMCDPSCSSNPERTYTAVNIFLSTVQFFIFQFVPVRVWDVLAPDVMLFSVVITPKAACENALCTEQVRK